MWMQDYFGRSISKLDTISENWFYDMQLVKSDRNGRIFICPVSFLIFFSTSIALRARRMSQSTDSVFIELWLTMPITLHSVFYRPRAMDAHGMLDCCCWCVCCYWCWIIQGSVFVRHADGESTGGREWHSEILDWWSDRHMQRMSGGKGSKTADDRNEPNAAVD